MLHSSRHSWRHSLSPYAQALKHVALRGGALALGPSAKEKELELYRRGALPADYRPMVQGKWDDTVERWAYAWQFPAREGTGGGAEGEGEEVIRLLSANTALMDSLLAMGQQLHAHPPSTVPGSGKASGSAWKSLSPTPTSSTLPPKDEEKDETQTAETVNHHRIPAEDAELQLLEATASGLPRHLFGLPATTTTATTTSSSSSSSETAIVVPEPALRSTPAAPVPAPFLVWRPPADSPLPAGEAPGALVVPMAYVEDFSERSAASQQLCALLESGGLEYTEDGLLLAISAMAVAGVSETPQGTPRRADDRTTTTTGYFEAAKALVAWAETVGIGPHAELYKALQRHATQTANTETAMLLIEEMKSKGITPRIGNWHELMRTLHRAGDYMGVAQVVDNMKMYANLEPSEVTFALQLRALAKAHASHQSFQALAEAVQLFDQMEQVYGYIASRPHYDALLFALSQSPAPEMRLRCQETAEKMERLGIVWNKDTYLHLIRSAQVVGDVEAVERYLSKMRDQGVPVTLLHLSWAVQAHVQRVKHSVLSLETVVVAAPTTTKIEALALQWREAHVQTCEGIYEIILDRGWSMQLPFLNALLHLYCQCTIGAMMVQKEEEGKVEPDEKAEEGGQPRAAAARSADIIGFFEDRANRLWSSGFREWRLEKDVYSYECYIGLLAHQQRIDEAERFFQELVLQQDREPTRRTYESLILMHLASGEEGGAARALHYLDAMERSEMLIRPSLLKKMVRVHNEAGYTRDMKRRARRIMQAREEYMARQAEGVANSFGGTWAASTPPTSPEEKEKEKEEGEGEPGDGASCPPAAAGSNLPATRPPARAPASTLEWWERWKAESCNKHELFEDEAADGTPRGESFPEKNAALAKLGIDSPYRQKSDVPTSSYARTSPTYTNGPPVAAPSPSSLLASIRAAEGGEVAGGIWSLDGGELSYPKDGGGPEGWGVRLWRERQLVKKAFQQELVRGSSSSSASSSSSPVPLGTLSSAGNAVRVAADQLDIERSGATTAGELSDWRRFESQRYDDGNAKPASEFAVAPGASGSAASPVAVSYGSELVWQQEAHDRLAPYKSDEELAMANDNTFYAAMEKESAEKTRQTIDALQAHREDEAGIHTRRGPARRTKYDYLEKWREMYRHGTLDVSDLAPPPSAAASRKTSTTTTSSRLLHFGRSPEDHRETYAATVRQWWGMQQEQGRGQPSSARRRLQRLTERPPPSDPPSRDDGTGERERAEAIQQRAAAREAEGQLAQRGQQVRRRRQRRKGGGGSASREAGE